MLAHLHSAALIVAWQAGEWARPCSLAPLLQKSQICPLQCQVPRAVQVEGHLSELHQHPSAPGHTCQIGCQKLAEGRERVGGKRGCGVGMISKSWGPVSNCWEESCSQGPGPAHRVRQLDQIQLHRTASPLRVVGCCWAKHRARWGHLCQGAADWQPCSLSPSTAWVGCVLTCGPGPELGGPPGPAQVAAGIVVPPAQPAWCSSR